VERESDPRREAADLDKGKEGLEGEWRNGHGITLRGARKRRGMRAPTALQENILCARNSTRKT